MSPWRRSDGSPIRILLIDDDEVLLQRTKDYLNAKSFDVITVSNIFEVPSIVGSRHPDLVVLDVRMPALSGDGVATTLQRLYTMPIVFYSAIDDDEGNALARNHKGAVFVSKAQGVRRLHEEVTRVVASLRSAQ